MSSYKQRLQRKSSFRIRSGRRWLLDGLLVGALLVFFIYDFGIGPERLGKTGAAGHKEQQHAKQALNPRKDLAELEQRAQQAIATAEAALAALPVSEPYSATASYSNSAQAPAIDTPSGGSQPQATNQSPSQLSDPFTEDEAPDNPSLTPQRQAKIDKLHRKLQQLQAQQTKQQQLFRDKQDSLSRYGLQ